MKLRGPRRIVCLSDETTEILYGLGADDRIVGISAYTVRPARAKRDKTIVSGFADGSVAKVAALRPDLVLGFSDVQASFAERLIRAGLPVLIFNQRSVDEILDTIETLGLLVDRADRAQRWTGELRARLDATHESSHGRPRPRVYFEEWYEPMICGIRWVSELIGIAGGQDVFAERARLPASAQREVTMEDLLRCEPELMFVSWCGEPFDPGRLRARRGFEALECVRNDAVVEIPSSEILQPGPAALTDGLAALSRHVDAWRSATASR